MKLKKLNTAVVDELRTSDLDSFVKDHTDESFEIMKVNNIIPLLNNQGRRPEQVYHSWMRGFVLSIFFLKAFSLILELMPTQ